MLAVADEVDAFNAAYNAACAEERYFDALNLVQGRTIDDALAWFAEVGVTFWRPPSGHKAPLSALAMAATAALKDLGERATYKQMIAQLALATLAQFRDSMLQAPPSGKSEVANWLAEIALSSAAVGSADGMMTMVRLGHFEKLSELEFDRVRRRAGAEVTNAKKQNVRDRALAAALLVTATNPTLSNEELAVKVREREHLPTTIKTITGWIRTWRKAGDLEPIKSGR